METPAEVETLAEGPSDSLIVAPQTTAYPTPLESSFHALIEAFANVSFHAEIQRGITFKPHRHQLPPAPKNYQNMQSHPFTDRWREAIQVEYGDLARLGSFSEVAIEEARGRILDLMWVFDYKFNEAGYLDRFKARLVVRGDKMWWGHGETYAATLASKSFRILLAIIAYFNLEADQMDVVSAFLNSPL